MKIHIDFEGLNKILCKLGLHRFTNWEDDQINGKYGLARYCSDCPRYQFKR